MVNDITNRISICALRNNELQKQHDEEVSKLKRELKDVTFERDQLKDKMVKLKKDADKKLKGIKALLGM